MKKLVALLSLLLALSVSLNIVSAANRSKTTFVTGQVATDERNLPEGHPCKEFGNLRGDYLQVQPQVIYDCFKSNANAGRYWTDRELAFEHMTPQSFLGSFSESDKPWIQEALQPRLQL